MDPKITQAKDNQSLETTNIPEAPSSEEPKKHFPILPLILGVPLACLLAAYISGACYYQKHFLNHTTINNIDVSQMTIFDLKAQIEDYSIPVIQRQADGTTLEEEISGSSIGLFCSSTEPFQEILENQNHWLWFLSGEEAHTLENLISYEESSLKDEIRNLSGFDKDFAIPPADAYITDYEPGQGFQMIQEVPGNKLNPKRTQDAIETAIKELRKEINLDEAGCYEEPEITVENEDLKAAFARLQSYTETTITYTFGSEKEVLDGDTICTWLQIDGYDITIDQAQVEEYVANLRKKYDTVFRPRTFQTSYGTEITIKNGDYGWWMDTEQEAIQLAEMIEQGESGERTPVYRQTAASYDTPDYGDTYVEINLTAQHLFLYKDGQKILESDFVSGSVIRGYGTPGGIYGLTYKQRDATLTGETYRTPVSFWMPFNNNIGMHDATWRREFGGNIYITNGSHGCINLPYSAAKEIYGYVEKGTPVICYYLPGTESVPEVTLPEDPNNPGVQPQEEAVPEPLPQEMAPAESPQEQTPEE